MKKFLCILLAILTMLSLLSITAGAANAKSEIDYTILFNMPIQTGNSDWSGRAFRVGPLVFVTYYTPQSNYRLKVYGAERNENNELEIFVLNEALGDVGLTVIGTGLLVLYVPWEDVLGARGVQVSYHKYIKEG